MNKRHFLQITAGLLAAAGLPRTAISAANSATRLLAGWRSTGAAGQTTDQVGVVAIDWQARQVALQSAIPVPTRVHGLRGLPDGGYLAAAYRYGRWVLHADAEGQLVRLLDITNETGRLAGGHIEPAPDGKHFYNTEIDHATGQGWISVRRLDTLQRVAEWRTQGMDPHMLLPDAEGRLMIANGGVRYLADGRKDKNRDLESNLVRLDPTTGQLLGQWKLDDPNLSIRHLAWNAAPDGRTLLGIALQAEHTDPARRVEAPVLAIWDGKTLTIATRSPLGEGYTGDIMAGPGGGFILSAQLSGKALLWHPGDSARLQLIGQLHRAGALAGPDADGGFLIAGEKGAARWHMRQASNMLAWPIPMSPDNHWALLDARRDPTNSQAFWQRSR